MDATQAGNVTLVRRYYDACNAGDLDALLGTLTPDAVHYFLPGNFAPVRGAEHFARYWVKNRKLFDARWTVDHVMAQGDEVVVEWSMFWTPQGGAHRIVTRGTEWYVMREGRIAEVRAYFMSDDAANTELAGFPYAQRGYPAALDGTLAGGTAMGQPVYALNLFNVADREEYLAYSRRSAKEVQAHGGRVVALGKFREAATGAIEPRTVMIVVEWASKEAFDSYRDDPKLADLHPHRIKGARDYIWHLFDKLDDLRPILKSAS